MRKLETIREFKNKHPKTELENPNEILGGSLSHQDRDTMDNWNCADIERQMLWEGSPCSAWFEIFQET